MAKIIRLNSSITPATASYEQTTSDIADILQAKKTTTREIKDDLQKLPIKHLEHTRYMQEQVSDVLSSSKTMHPKTLEKLEKKIEASFDPLAVEIPPASEDEVHQEILSMLKHKKAARKAYLEHPMTKKKKDEEYTQKKYTQAA